METIAFKTFIKENNLRNKLLPDPIQDKIDIYYRMLDLKKTLTSEDLDELERQLDTLDQEIIEDIKTTYKDRLPFKKQKKNKDKTVVSKEKTIADVPKLSSQTSDETLLEKLMEGYQKRFVYRSTLRQLGVNVKLTNRLRIGKFHLKRTGFFTFQYCIERQ